MSVVPSKSFIIAGALAWSGLIAAMVTVPRQPTIAGPATRPDATPAGAVVAARSGVTAGETAPAFDSRFGGEVMTGPPALKRGDRLPIRTIAPTPVEPAPVVAPVKVAYGPAVDEMPARDEVRHKPKRHKVERNVCTRHGMRKVSIRHGKSWRCRR